MMSVQTAMEAVREPALTLLARLSAGVLTGLVSETAGFVTTLMSVLGMKITVIKAARTLLGPLSAPAGLDTGSMPMEGHVMVSASHSLSLSPSLPSLQPLSLISSDIDECAVNTDGCEDTCINNVGSFTCVCDPGYALDTNGRTCSSEETDLQSYNML